MAVVLVILWDLGLVTSHTMGGFIHLLLVLAIIVILIRVTSGRSAAQSRSFQRTHSESRVTMIRANERSEPDAASSRSTTE